MDDKISRIITDIEESQHELISQSTLSDLRSLLDTDDAELIDRFYGSLPPSSLLRPVSATMDAPDAHLSVLASDVYLSLLLSPNSPVFTLFTPVAFLSLLGSIRRYLKRLCRNEPGSAEVRASRAAAQRGNKKKRGRGSGNVTKDWENEAGNVAEDGSFDVKLPLRVLQKLGSVLGLVHLDRFPDSLKSLVQTASEIPVIALEISGFVSLEKLTDLCGRILCEVLRADHGDLVVTAGEISKSLTPLILMGKSQARNFALGFLSKRMIGLARDSCEVKKAVVNLPKYLAHKAPEKAEPRGLAVEAIMEIVKAMENGDQIAFVEYVMKMAQGKSNMRLLAVDLIPMLVISLKNPLGVSSDSETKDNWSLRCLDSLIHRCSDSNALIRARALSNLAQVVGFLSSEDRNRVILKEALGFSGDASNGKMVINDLLRKRCVDEKAAVRKAALLLVNKLTSFLGGCFDGTVLKMMGMACSDPLVSIRKAAVSALSEAFRTSSNESVTTEWLLSVPRMITDNESTIQEACENLFLELVLERISRAESAGFPHVSFLLNGSKKDSKYLEQELESLFPEGVLGLLKEICNSEVSPWVKKICGSLGKKKRLKPKIALALQTIIKASETLWLSRSMPIDKWTAPPGAWFLLSEVSAYLSKSVEWEFLHHHWQLLDKNGLQGLDAQRDEEGIESGSVTWAGDRVFLLQTISNVSMELPPEPAADLAHNLLKKIEEFNLHSAEVDAHVKALRILCKRKASNSEESDNLVKKWVEQVLSKASEIVEKYISETTNSKNNSFSTPATTGNRKSKRMASRSRKLSKVVMAVYTIGSLLIICPLADTSGVIPLLHSIITSENSGVKLNNKLPRANVSLKQTAPSLYNQAWLTMGKICLADGKLAKRYIPLFAQELEKSDCAALRNNLVVAMADFCVHYTAMVDCYITKITKCLRDPCELVRRQTFILLSRLLQRDYVKWRGVLFLRFLLSLVDESEKIRQLADFLFGNILKVKAPLLAYNSFVEAIYVLNDCHVHNEHNNDSKGSRTKNQAFSIRGNDEKSSSKRMHIYVTLLKQMAPEHLLATFAKLCVEVLAAASDGMLNIEDITGQSVLQDAFQILACKEIRLSTTRSSSETAEIEEDVGGDSAAAKGRVITQAVRKGLIQNTIPIFIELKRLLESKNSPLTGSLMDCLRVLLKDYKNEIDEILVADKQLQKELIYDMQKYEAAKARSVANEAIASKASGLACGTNNSNRSQDVACGESSTSRVSGVACGASKSGVAREVCNRSIPVVSSAPSNGIRVSRVDSKVADAMADVAAAMAAKSVLKEVNKGTATPPLSSKSVPKLKCSGRPPEAVLESLRRRQCFMSDDENWPF